MLATWESTVAKRQTEPDRRDRKARSLKILTVIGLICGLVSLGGLSACGKTEPTPKTTKSQPSNSQSAAKPEKHPDTWPLTGMPRPEDAAKRRAIAVKVENTVAARPQSGLESADIIFEEMVEGGITRYNAIFHSNQPGEIGPVRSVRPMDPAIAAPFGSWLVYSGGQPLFERRVHDEGLRGFNEDQAKGAEYRVRWRKMPHNLYLSIPALFQKLGAGEGGLGDGSDGGEPAPGSAFAFAKPGETPTAVSAGVAARQLLINFPAARVRFDWNGTRWQRFDEGAASVSRAGIPLQGDNVVVIRTSVVNSEGRDSAGNPVPETVMIGGGQAYVATGGKILDAKWAKDSLASPLKLTDVAGSAVTLAPGQTWVELLAAGTFSYQ